MGNLLVRPNSAVGVQVLLSNGKTALVPAQMLVDGTGNPISGASAVATVRSVSAATGNQQILNANPSRIRDTIVNDSTATMYVLEGTQPATPTLYTYAIAPKTSQPGYYEATDWKGPVQVAWSAADGAARVTERS